MQKVKLWALAIATVAGLVRGMQLLSLTGIADRIDTRGWIALCFMVILAPLSEMVRRLCERHGRETGEVWRWVQVILYVLALAAWLLQGARLFG